MDQGSDAPAALTDVTNAQSIAGEVAPPGRKTVHHTFVSSMAGDPIEWAPRLGANTTSHDGPRHYPEKA